MVRNITRSEAHTGRERREKEGKTEFGSWVVISDNTCLLFLPLIPLAQSLEVETAPYNANQWLGNALGSRPAGISSRFGVSL